MTYFIIYKKQNKNKSPTLLYSTRKEYNFERFDNTVIMVWLGLGSFISLPQNFGILDNIE